MPSSVVYSVSMPSSVVYSVRNSRLTYAWYNNKPIGIGHVPIVYNEKDKWTNLCYIKRLPFMMPTYYSIFQQLVLDTGNGECLTNCARWRRLWLMAPDRMYIALLPTSHVDIWGNKQWTSSFTWVQLHRDHAPCLQMFNHESRLVHFYRSVDDEKGGSIKNCQRV